MSKKEYQELKVGESVIHIVEDGYGDFEVNKIYIVSCVSDDLTRIKVLGCDLWWYKDRFMKVQEKFSLCLYPGLKINKEDAISFHCPSCNKKIFTEIKDEIDMICYYCGAEIY